MKKEDVVLKIENVSKQYRLGLVGTGTLADDLKRWWYRLRGKEDPFLKVGVENDRSKKSDDQYVWALKDISFEVKRGEVIGIIGKNGAGKSTLLKLLSKVADPTIGTIKYKGRIAALLEVGTGFHPELTGRENIFLNGAVLGMKKHEIEEKVDEIIEFSGVAKYVDTPVKRYSSGMIVRLGFAVAAHLEPDILIVDEVLAVGDADFQKKCIGKMKDVAGEGRTVLFVSHNMASIRNLCEKGIVMDKGAVIYQGDVESAISRYLQKNGNFSQDVIQTNIASDISGGTGEAKFTKVHIENESNEVVNNLFFREKPKIVLELEVLKKIGNANITISILSRFSETAVFGVSKNEKYESSSFEKGKYIIEVSVDQILMPGNFALSFGIHYFHTGATINSIEYFYPFEVKKETKNGDFEYPWATVHGYVEMLNDWQINKIENNE